MKCRIHWMKAPWLVIALWGAVGAASAAQGPQPPTISLEKVKLSQAVRLLMAQNPDAEVLFVDPEGKLADRTVPFVQIRAKSLEDALKQLCRSIDIHFWKDEDGVYVLSATPQKPAQPMPARPMQGEQPQAVEPPAERVTTKIAVQYADIESLLQMLLNSHTRRSADEIRAARHYDDLDVTPGIIDPTTGSWYYPNLAPPILTPHGFPGVGGPTAGNQRGGFGGGGLGGFGGGGLGGGGLGGFGGGGLGGGGLGGFGGGGLGGGGLGGFGGGGLGGFGGGGLGGGGLGGFGGGGGLGGGGGGLIPDVTVLGYPLDNSLIVNGTEDGIQQLRDLIRLLDVAPRQLSIKMEQIAVSTSFLKTFGVDWSIIQNDILVTSGLGQSSGGTINVGVLGGSWRVQLAAGLTSGTATVIDSLEITTMNGVPATLIQTATSTVFIPQTTLVQGAGSITTFTPLPFPIPTIFSATPRINGDDTITMFIPFLLSRITDFATSPDGQLRFPNFISTSLAAVRRVASGQTIVVGGVTNATRRNDHARIPILGDLPLVGPLFRSKRQDRNDIETLFFFTPTILEEEVATGGVGGRTTRGASAGTGPR